MGPFAFGTSIYFNGSPYDLTGGSAYTPPPPPPAGDFVLFNDGSNVLFNDGSNLEFNT